MTLQQILDAFTQYQTQSLYFFLGIPLLAVIAIFFKKKYSKNLGVKVFNSLLIYLVSVPGILSLILSIYSIFILKGNILELNILPYFVPLISMGVTYTIIQKNIGLKEVPGFGKISSLLLLIFLSFIVVFILQRMFIGIIFVGSIGYIIGLFVIIFVAMKLVFDKMTK
ncbi:hypothetical protein LR004_00865 [Candidatus Gracilibacteria bacterium]|nr:hypothetical protein [Candidatus Gracilibacteria bacterium]